MTQSKNRFLLAILAGTLLLTLLPPAQAELEIPFTEVLPRIGVLDTTSSIWAASYNEEVGLLLKYSTSGNLAFAVGNANDGFTIMDQDITTGGVAASTINRLIAFGPGDWAMAYALAGVHHLWTTTDNGATWTEQTVFAVSDSGDMDLHSPIDNVIDVIVETTDGGARNIKHYRGTNLGTTWTAGQVITDSNTSPLGAAGASLCTTNLNGATIAGNPGNVIVMYGCQTSATAASFARVYSSDGNFWSSPAALDTGCQETGGSPYASKNREGTILIGYNTRQTGQSCSVGSNDDDALAWLSYDLQTFTMIEDIGNGIATVALASNGASYGLSTGTAIRYNEAIGTLPPVVETLDDTSGGYNIIFTPTRYYHIQGDPDVGGATLIRSAAINYGVSGNYWCSDPTIDDYAGDGLDGIGDDDFGYNYVEQVSFFEDSADSGAGGIVSRSSLADGYEFTSESDNLAYMGKGWTTPTVDYAKVQFRIESSAEGQESIFRPVFSFETGTPSSTTKGDGYGTGAFLTHVGARFREVGNDWRMNLEFNNGGSTPTQVGNAVFGFSPNTPRTFSLTIDTTGAGYVLLRDETGNQTIINQTMAGSGYTGLSDLAGGDPITSQWFLTSGSSTVINSYTFLDDNLDSGQVDDSTCIFFRQNIEVVGAPGTTPGSVIALNDTDDPDTSGACTAIFCPPSGGIGGISSESLSLFLGIVIVASFAASMSSKTGTGAAGVAIFSLLGLFLAYALGYIQLWVIIVLTVLGVASIFLGIRSGSQGANL